MKKHINLFTIITFIISLSGSSCIIRDGYTVSSFIITNQTKVLIKIFPSISMTDTLHLKSNESLNFKRGQEMGKGNGINLAFFADGNPVTVIFNNEDTIKHYNDTLNHVGNYYNIKSERCFYNPKSYTKQIEPIGKQSNDVKLYYTFTEQDYLDAQK